MKWKSAVSGVLLSLAMLVASRGDGASAPAVPSVAPIQEIAWTARGGSFTELGQTGNGLFGISAKPMILETWRWQDGTLKKDVFVQLAEQLHTAVLPDGRYLASLEPANRGGAWAVVVASAATNAQVGRWEVPSGWWNSCNISHSRNGEFALVVISAERGESRFRVGVIDVPSMKLRWVDLEVAGPGGSVLTEHTAISNDGKYAAIGNSDYRVVVIDTVTQKVLWNQTPPDMWIPADAMFALDGSRIYLGDSARRLVLVIETTTGKVLGRRIVSEEGKPVYGDGVTCMALSPDDKRLAVAMGSYGHIFLFDTDSDASRTILPHGLPSADAVSFSPDGKRLASVGGGRIKAWDAPQAVSRATAAPVGEVLQDIHPPTPPEPRGCKGKVVTAAGKPVEGARVRVMEASGNLPDLRMKVIAEVVTGSDGSFSAEYAPAEGGRPALATLIVDHKDLSLGWTIIGRPQQREVTIKLTTPAKMSGIVVDEEGAPVAGARLQAEMFGDLKKVDAEMVRGYEGLTEFVSVTGANGRFVFSDFPQYATARFWVSAQGRASMWCGRLLDNPPGLEYRAGQKDIHIVLPKEAVIKGVTDDKATGKPMPGIRLVAEDVDALDKPTPLLAHWDTSREDGSFEIGVLPPGRYTLKPEPNADGSLDVIIDNIEVSLKAGQVVEGVQLKVSSGGVIEVTVTDATSGERLSGVFISMRDRHGKWLSGYVRNSGVGIMRLPPGEYSLQSARKRGYAEHVLSRTVQLKEGDRVTIAVTMERASE